MPERTGKVNRSEKKRALRRTMRGPALVIARVRTPMLTPGHGAIRQKGLPEGPQGDARAEAGNPQVGPLGQEGEEPQAGDRDRPLAGSPRRRKGPQEEEPALRPPAKQIARASSSTRSPRGAP